MRGEEAGGPAAMQSLMGEDQCSGRPRLLNVSERDSLRVRLTQEPDCRGDH